MKLPLEIIYSATLSALAFYGLHKGVDGAKSLLVLLLWMRAAFGAILFLCGCVETEKQAKMVYEASLKRGWTMTAQLIVRRITSAGLAGCVAWYGMPVLASFLFASETIRYMTIDALMRIGEENI